MMLAGHTVIYGGSFNPPHIGHQIACLYLLEALQADCVWLMPAYAHPFSKTLAAFDARVAMCKLMLSPFGTRAEVSILERDLAEQGGRGLTYDLLIALQQQFPQRRFALAIGADIHQETHAWHRWDTITEMVPIVTLGRTGYPSHAAVDLPQVSSTAIREHLQNSTSIEGLVPASVAAYIEEHDLY